MIKKYCWRCFVLFDNIPLKRDPQWHLKGEVGEAYEHGIGCVGL